eukprot:6888228-Pyramimonas_sp.AAC.1
MPRHAVRQPLWKRFSRRSLGAILGLSECPRGASCGTLEVLLELSWGFLGAFLGLFGGSGRHLGAALDPLAQKEE